MQQRQTPIQRQRIPQSLVAYLFAFLKIIFNFFSFGLNKNRKARQWWHKPLIPALERQRPDRSDLCKFEASLVYWVSSRTARTVTHGEPVSETKQTTTKSRKGSLAWDQPCCCSWENVGLSPLKKLPPSSAFCFKLGCWFRTRAFDK